jgi:hypothetical protein
MIAFRNMNRFKEVTKIIGEGSSYERTEIWISRNHVKSKWWYGNGYNSTIS